MGFTHVELLPVQEHPLDESWGYQVSGFYAVTKRFGTPEDFQWFVNHLHKNGVGVILDWVPGHFPTDDFSLGRFDGTALYEHEDARQGFHPHWNTFIFNFGRHEVSNFLIGNALYWAEMMHIDGLRVDAVASMLYLDYGREEGNWIPNRYGGKENLEAIEFFKHLNSVLHQSYPGFLTIAEESTSFPGVSHPLEHGGLGFDMKWNMGWMNDTLRYFSKAPLFRHYHQNDLTFSLLYAFSERFVLVLSHDEVVHGKNSLMGRMPGDMWQQFANMRLLYSYMICQPGKKLLFMGGEIGQWNEWNCKSSIEWDLLKFPNHHSLQTMIKDLNHFYLTHAPLWERDFDHSGFEWIDFGDRHNCVISYYRKGAHGMLMCIHNFTPNFHSHYFLPAAGIAKLDEVFNTDAEKYGGSGKINARPRIIQGSSGHPVGVEIQLAPLATMVFEVSFL
jgi:1,4-alpha-glucan branching enzyme